MVNVESEKKTTKSGKVQLSNFFVRLSAYCKFYLIFNPIFLPTLLHKNSVKHHNKKVHKSQYWMKNCVKKIFNIIYVFLY